MRTCAKRWLLRAASLALIAGVTACSSVPPHTEEQSSAELRPAMADRTAARTAMTEVQPKQTMRREPSIADRVQPPLPADWIVFFAPGDSQLSSDSMSAIKDLADKLKSSREQDAQLTAKSNEMGSHSLCLALAANRLSALVSKLLQLGVRYDQLRQQNMGCETTKLARTSCQAAGCVDPNERIEIRLIR